MVECYLIRKYKLLYARYIEINAHHMAQPATCYWFNIYHISIVCYSNKRNWKLLIDVVSWTRNCKVFTSQIWLIAELCISSGFPSIQLCTIFNSWRMPSMYSVTLHFFSYLFILQWIDFCKVDGSISRKLKLDSNEKYFPRTKHLIICHHTQWSTYITPSAVWWNSNEPCVINTC